MSEMVARVAAAIATLESGMKVYSWEDLARAAITAMREPTNAMHLAAKEKREADKRKNQPTAWGDIYRTMIDAALSEKDGDLPKAQKSNK